MSAYRSSLFWSLKKEVSEKLPQGSSRASRVFGTLQQGCTRRWTGRKTTRGLLNREGIVGMEYVPGFTLGLRSCDG